MNKLTIVTVVGTRPEIIRLSRLIARLDRTVNHVLVHTGQNYDPLLNEIFFTELQIREPDYYLNVDTSSLASVLGTTLIKIERIFKECAPDAVVILGDTNSAVAALLAKRMQIPVYHLEAGNRSFDENVPEETNRRMIDHVSDFNLPYTEHARRNLLAEGIAPRRVSVTGSPMLEILTHYAEPISKSDVLERLSLQPQRYFLVSAHRQENIDNSGRLKELVETLTAVHEKWNLPVLISTHPRTRNRLAQILDIENIPGLFFHEPFGFLDYVKLQMNSLAVLSDSGTVSEESTILGFPAVTIRDSIERPEALDSGGIVMTGLGKSDVIRGLVEVIGNPRSQSQLLPTGYEIMNFSERVLRFVMSTVGRHHFWAGIRAESPNND
jgi:UDP-N-acetylglucosamine 2-epimerase